jgi:hypothetical protein
MSQVFDMNRGVWIQYSLSPRDAVVAAYEQFTKGNWNTWTYKAPDCGIQYASLQQPGQGPDPRMTVVTCGNFTTVCRTEQLFTECPQDYEASAHPNTDSKLHIKSIGKI